MVIASHSEDIIRNLCNKALLLEHGKQVAIGNIDDILLQYSNANVV